jgi:hypothetical protein
MRDFLYTAATRNLPDGAVSTYAAVDASSLVSTWHRNGFMNGAPGASSCVSTPGQYFSEQFGSHTNREALVLCNKHLNSMKGRLFDIKLPTNSPTDPISDANMRDWIAQAPWNAQARDYLFEALGEIIAVFNYINHPQALPIIQRNINHLQAAADEIASRSAGLSNLGNHLRVFVPNYYRYVAQRARTFVERRLNETEIALDNAISPLQARPPNEQYIRARLVWFRIALSQIRSPFQ